MIKKPDDQNKYSYGFSLVEMMVCIMVIGLLMGLSTHLFQREMAILQLQRVAHSFIDDAQLSRQYSRVLSTAIAMRPLQTNDWRHGWQIQVWDESRDRESETLKQFAFKTAGLDNFIQIPEAQLKATQQFTDISSPLKSRQIIFKNGQIALLHNGGFVANRIIWQHTHYPDMQRHLILGPGGRWRICNPKEDNQACLSH